MPDAVVPLAAQSVHGTVWTLANRFGVVARSPGELVGALTGLGLTGAAVVTSPPAAGEPAEVAELVRALRDLGHIRLVTPPGREPGNGVDGRPAPEPETAPRPPGTAPDAGVDGLGREASAGPSDLGDPAVVCAADPVGVTAAYEHGTDAPGGGPDGGPGGGGGPGEHGGSYRRPDEHGGSYRRPDAHGGRHRRPDAPDGRDEHGGLRAAWFRAGQSLIREQPPAERALVLLTALGDDADPRLRPALNALAATATWRSDWTRVRGDVAPPWPGPVAALAQGTGRWAEHLLVADQRGAIRSVRPADAVPAPGTATMPVRITALAPLPDGTLLMLDERGRLRAHGETPLTDAVAATLDAHPGTALAATGRLVLVGDRHGSLHAFGYDGMHQAAAHRGRVTAVAVADGPAPLVCSGGADGTVRTWTPGRGPENTPFAERDFPVTALAVHGRTLAVAWADGLVELRRLGTAEALPLRPGPPVRAVAVAGERSVVIGTDDTLFRVTARALS
ncbi:WD40 repeat domain-containing protein [Streptomyces wuyuanensis]|uniref:WD40 repeat domain-containing protein n=1 Tax=Streptomyces wuyuanensis TaxID=1196353 RepID=UPI003711F492